MRLMTTSSSGRVGKVHPQARNGDSLYWLQGCSLPIGLRKSQFGEYYVVGEAYIHPIDSFRPGVLGSPFDKSDVEEISLR